MKKIFLLVCFLITLILFSNFKVEASVWETREIVPPNKEWVISLSDSYDPHIELDKYVEVLLNGKK